MAWTYTVSLDNAYDMGNDVRRFRFKFDCTSDASASGDLVLSTAMKLNTSEYTSDQVDFLMTEMAGGSLLSVHYVPDGTDTPTSNPTVTVDDKDGCLLFSYAFTAATAEAQAGAEEKGYYPPIANDLIFTSTTLANTKKAVFYVWVEK